MELPAAGVLGDADVRSFRKLVLAEGAGHWRELPWRNIDDPYAVLVSEVMLQQTQVKRVLNYWPRFMGLFPTVDALASAETSLVLEMWQGLGYNRRALALKRAAAVCAAEHDGILPETLEELTALPGIGPATAGGVMAFAHGKPCVYLETNVRSVFIHVFFPHAEKVPDSTLVPLVRRTCPESGVRDWYYALLDYGAHLKKNGANPSRRSAQHRGQSAFEGSWRQKRAALLRIVLGAPGISTQQAHTALDEVETEAGRPPLAQRDFERLVAELAAEGFFRSKGGALLP